MRFDLRKRRCKARHESGERCIYFHRKHPGPHLAFIDNALSFFVSVKP